MLPSAIEPQLVPAASGEADVIGNVLYGVDQLLTAVGYTSYTSNNPYPNTRWYQSRGESGDHNVVFGLGYATGVGQLRLIPFCAADLNSFGASVGVSSLTTVAGHVNDDNSSVVNVNGASAGPRYALPNPGSTSFNSGITPRDPTSDIEFWACANKDRFHLLARYASNIAAAQLVLSAGMAASTLANELHKTARARIYSITALGGTQWRVVLDRNINNAINDIAGGDPDPYKTRLFFQTVATSAAEIAANTGYAQAERVSMINGTLTTDGSGRTQFDVDTAACSQTGGASGKLWAPGNRYARATPLGTILSPANGLGDIVSLVGEPNYAFAAARNDGSVYNEPNGFCVASWRGNGGQRAFTPNATPGANAASWTPCAMTLSNHGFNGLHALGNYPTQNDPSPSSNLTVPGAVYLTHQATVSDSSVIPNTDNNAIDSVFWVPDLIISPKVTGVPDRAIGKRDAKMTERYRFMEFVTAQGLNGMGTNALGSPSSFEYQRGLRAKWV